MPGKGVVSLQQQQRQHRKTVWLWWSELSRALARASCGARNSGLGNSILPPSGEEVVHGSLWTLPSSMESLLKLQALPPSMGSRVVVNQQCSEGFQLQVSAKATAATIVTRTQRIARADMKMRTSSAGAVVPPRSSDHEIATSVSNRLGYRTNGLEILLSGSAGYKILEDAIMRHRFCQATMEASSGTFAGRCSNQRTSPSNVKSQCASYTNGSRFDSIPYNDCHYSTALELESDPVASLRSKDGSSNCTSVGRLGATASDGECACVSDAETAENLDVSPMEVIRPEVSDMNDSSSPGSTRCRPISDVRRIHSLAVVHPEAVLGEDVEIGPFCIVGPKVVLGKGCKLHPNCHVSGETELGEKCVLMTGAVVGADIPGKTIIGAGNTIGYYAVVGVRCQDMKYKDGSPCSLHIGNNNDIREYVSIHRSSKRTDLTVIGDDNLIMGACHVAHDCKIGNRNIFANGTLLGGHVVVEDLVHTGGGVAAHQFCNIGSYAFLAGGSVVERDVPMFMMVAGDRAELRGLNLEGMRRCGFSDLEVRTLRKAYQLLFMNTDANTGGLEERLAEVGRNEDLSKVPVVRKMLKSVRACFGENRRGICRFRDWTTR